MRPFAYSDVGECRTAPAPRTASSPASRACASARSCSAAQTLEIAAREMRGCRAGRRCARRSRRSPSALGDRLRARRARRSPALRGAGQPVSGRQAELREASLARRRRRERDARARTPRPTRPRRPGRARDRPRASRARSATGRRRRASVAPRCASRRATSGCSAAASPPARRRGRPAAPRVLRALEVLGAQVPDRAPRTTSAARRCSSRRALCSSDAYAPSRISACEKPNRAPPLRRRARGRAQRARVVARRLVAQRDGRRARRSKRWPATAAACSAALLRGGRRSRRASTTLSDRAGNRVAVGAALQQLGEEQRIALRALDAAARDVGMRVEVRSGELQRLVGRQRLQVAALDACRAATRRSPDRRRAGSCSTSTIGARARAIAQRRERVEHRGRRPVDVLDEDQRPAAPRAARDRQRGKRIDAPARARRVVHRLVAAARRAAAIASRSATNGSSLAATRPTRSRGRARRGDAAASRVAASAEQDAREQACVASRPCAAPKSSTSARWRGAAARPRARASIASREPRLAHAGSPRTSQRRAVPRVASAVERAPRIARSSRARPTQPWRSAAAARSARTLPHRQLVRESAHRRRVPRDSTSSREPQRAIARRRTRSSRRAGELLEPRREIHRVAGHRVVGDAPRCRSSRRDHLAARDADVRRQRRADLGRQRLHRRRGCRTRRAPRARCRCRARPARRTRAIIASPMCLSIVPPHRAISAVDELEVARRGADAPPRRRARWTSARESGEVGEQDRDRRGARRRRGAAPGRRDARAALRAEARAGGRAVPQSAQARGRSAHRRDSGTILSSRALPSCPPVPFGVSSRCARGPGAHVAAG